MQPPVLNLNGYTALPSGHIATVVTYLEMFAPPVGPPRLPLAGAGLSLLGRLDEPRYTAIYRKLGERWIWFSRLEMSIAKRAAIIGHSKAKAFAFVLNGEDAGLLELDFRVSGEVELAFFGLFDTAVGQGAGRWLMDRALEHAFARVGVRRFWVHTCTFDHPRAVEFYVKAGFTPYAQALEVVPDPRLTGVLPRGAAAHVPVIGAHSPQRG